MINLNTLEYTSYRSRKGRSSGFRSPGSGRGSSTPPARSKPPNAIASVDPISRATNVAARPLRALAQALRRGYQRRLAEFQEMRERTTGDPVPTLALPPLTRLQEKIISTFQLVSYSAGHLPQPHCLMFQALARFTIGQYLSGRFLRLAARDLCHPVNLIARCCRHLPRA